MNTFTYGIIGAMEVEVEALRAAMQIEDTRELSGMTFFRGTLDGAHVVLTQSGIGKVAAAVAAEILAVVYRVDALINTGVGGGIADGLNIGDVVAATALVQHDMDTTPLGDPPGLISGINVVYLPADETLSAALEAAMDEEAVPHRRGIIASGDQFISSEQEKNRLRTVFDASVCEMEGASIAHVAYLNRLPCAVLRAISDNGNADAAVDYPTFVKHAAARSTAVLRRFLARHSAR